MKQLKIVVIDGGKGGSDTFGQINNYKKNSNPKKEKNNLYKVLNYNDTVRRAMIGDISPNAQLLTVSALSVAKQTARSFINYYVSDIGRQNGDSNYQAIVERRIEQATDITGFITGAFSGGAMGSIGGPIGATIGAVAGVASHGVSLMFKYGERERQFQHEIFKQNISQAYGLSRAGFNALTGRPR